MLVPTIFQIINFILGQTRNEVAFARGRLFGFLPPVRYLVFIVFRE